MPYTSSRSSSGRRYGALQALPLALVAAAALLMVCALGGGSPRVDPLSLLYVRPAVALILATLLLLPGRAEFGLIKVPCLLLAAWAAIMAAQLVPLLPSIWTALPGPARFIEAASIAGIDQPWRPIAFIPVLTWNALLATVPAFAGLVAPARLDAEGSRVIAGLIVAVALASALLGVLQIASGEGYLYAVTSPGLPVGLFANRNHQAAFLALALPWLAVWAHGPVGGRDGWARVRPALALGATLFLLTALAVTGSRAGLALAVIGLAVAAWLAPPLPLHRLRRRYRRAAKVALVVLPFGVIALAAVFGRALAIDRLVAMAGAGEEQRAAALPTLWVMLRETMPVGTGAGFDVIFRIWEPDAALHRSSFNHAHNDLIELALTGGALAIAVLVAFLIWLAVTVLRARGAGGMTPHRWAALATVVILLLSSMVDYPLRTPFLALVFALAVGWVAGAGLSVAAPAAKPARRAYR